MMRLTMWPTIAQNSCKKCTARGSRRTLPHGEAYTNPNETTASTPDIWKCGNAVSDT